VAVQLEVKFDTQRSTFFVLETDGPFHTLEGTGLDGLALKEFKAVVKGQGMRSMRLGHLANTILDRCAAARSNFLKAGDAHWLATPSEFVGPT
jgi:hypothetical protein